MLAFGVTFSTLLSFFEDTMRTNLYNSNGQTFDDEMVINDIYELADYVNDRYSLDSEAEVVYGSFSVLVFTGNAQNVLFEAFTQGNETVCGSIGIKSNMVTPNEHWAMEIIKFCGLTKADLNRDHGYPITEAVCDAVTDMFEDFGNYDGFMETLQLPCKLRDVDDLIYLSERTLESIYDKVTDRLEKLVCKILEEKVEARVSHSRYRSRAFRALENDDTVTKPDKRKLNGLIKRIYNNAEVKRLTSKVFTDDGAWGPFLSLIDALNNIDGVVHVSYGDSKRSGLSNGYNWVSLDGKTSVMKDKIRDIVIDTDFGTLGGEIICSGAGSIREPLERYDMTLQLWIP